MKYDRNFHAVAGFTLIEVLATVVILSGVVSILFSTMGSLRRTERFRDEATALSQNANYAFEPIIQALKQADASESLRTPQGCVTVRGFYGLQASGTLESNSITSGQPFTFTNEGGRLVLIDTEKRFDNSQLGSMSRWIRRDYFMRSRPNGATTIVEKWYEATPTYAWPKELRSSPSDCEVPSVHWQPMVETIDGVLREKEIELTSSNVKVTNFTVALVPSIVTPDTTLVSDVPVPQNGPFVTVSVTVDLPKATRTKPVTLRTTITPTFTLGDVHDE